MYFEEQQVVSNVKGTMVVTHFDFMFRKLVSVLFCFAENVFQPDLFACIDYNTVILNVLYTLVAGYTV